MVDTFEALTHERPYRKAAFSVSDAMKEIIEKGRGIYDGLALKSLMKRIGLYPVMSLVELSNRKIARVVKLNPQFPLSPMVKIEFDEHGNKVKDEPLLDLAEHQIVHILNVVRNTAPADIKDHAEHRQSHHDHGETVKKKNTWWKDLIPVILITLVAILLLYVVLKI